MLMDVTKEFLKLVSIDSPSKKEGKLAVYLKKRLKDLGAEVLEDNSAAKTGSDTGNIIGYYPGNVEGASAVMFGAHMDTVVSTKGMKPVIKDGIIYSDGKTVLGADDKSGIAVILASLDRLANDASIPHGPLEIVFTVQEEIGLIGAKNLNYALKADFGYVLDADGKVGTVVNQTPSHVIIDFVIKGKAAHAGVAPEQGINAIVVASEAIAGLKSGRIDEETTSNFGIINGGSGRNMVPERVELKAEVRSRNELKLDQEVSKMISKFEETVKKYGAKLEYKKELAYRAFKIEGDELVAICAKKAAEEIGVESIFIPTGGGLDANFFNSTGLPCLALGVGNEDPHMKEESQSIRELEKAVEYVLGIIKQSSNNVFKL
ncbi:MAG: M20/M25/M40 family metallo-hydrolase [Eubacteriales bacterium]